MRVFSCSHLPFQSDSCDLVTLAPQSTHNKRYAQGLCEWLWNFLGKIVHFLFAFC